MSSALGSGLTETDAVSGTVEPGAIVNTSPVVGLVSNVGVGQLPSSVEYDPVNGRTYVTNEESGTVSVLAGVSLVATVDAGPGDDGIAVNTVNGTVY
ncbi:MAG: hypothetical protein ACREEC_09515, partial [Thermoplasmata archaeon]